MISRIYFVLLLTVTFTKSYAQINDEINWQYVLQQNKTNLEYKFTDCKNESETYLKYLGVIKTEKGNRYKVITSVWRWGLSLQRATSRILIFDNKDKYIAYCYVSVVYDLPDEIKNNKLVFHNTDPDCDLKLITEVSFENGIPKDFFRKCKGNSGDIYRFYCEKWWK